MVVHDITTFLVSIHPTLTVIQAIPTNALDLALDRDGVSEEHALGDSVQLLIKSEAEDGDHGRAVGGELGDTLHLEVVVELGDITGDNDVNLVKGAGLGVGAQNVGHGAGDGACNHLLLHFCCFLSYVNILGYSPDTNYPQ